MARGDKAIIYSKDSRAVSAFYEIINGKLKANAGKYDWGITTSQAYYRWTMKSFLVRICHLLIGSDNGQDRRRA